MATSDAITYGVLLGIQTARRDPHWPREAAIDDALAMRRLARHACRDPAAMADLRQRAASNGAQVTVSSAGVATLTYPDGRTIEVPR